MRRVWEWRVKGRRRREDEWWGRGEVWRGEETMVGRVRGMWWEGEEGRRRG